MERLCDESADSAWRAISCLSQIAVRMLLRCRSSGERAPGDLASRLRGNDVEGKVPCSKRRHSRGERGRDTSRRWGADAARVSKFTRACGAPAAWTGRAWTWTPAGGLLP